MDLETREDIEKAYKKIEVEIKNLTKQLYMLEGMYKLLNIQEEKAKKEEGK